MSEIKSITDFGADPTGERDSTEAINACIAAIKQAGGGEIRIDNGHFLTGSLELCSNLIIDITASATLQFMPIPDLYPPVVSRWEGADAVVHRACLYGNQIQNVTIKGQGTIDGSGDFWWKTFKSQRLVYPRPYLISIEHAQHVMIQDLKLMNSPSWTVHPMESQQVKIQNIFIKNPYDSPNTDGVNPESCQNVWIENCTFDVGDDCIAIKSGTEQAKIKSPCEDIIISGCIMQHGHGGVVIGSEMSGDIHRVLISGCIFNNTDRGIRMKTRRGRGGYVSDISVNNIMMNNVICPIVINAYYYCGPGGQDESVADRQALPINDQTPFFDNINISNVIANRTKSCALFIYGLPEAPVKGLKLTNLSINLVTPNSKGAVVPDMFKDGPKMSGEKIFLVNTDQTNIKNITINGDDQSLFYKEEHNQSLRM